MYFVCATSQVSGPSGQMSWIRHGPESLDAWNISEAIDNRLPKKSNVIRRLVFWFGGDFLVLLYFLLGNVNYLAA